MHKPVIVPHELISFIEEGHKFIIAGHQEPDGDCIGSQLVLGEALNRLGKKVLLCSAGPFKRPEIVHYRDRFTASINEADRYGAQLIIVDCSTLCRTGTIASLLEGLPTAIIDHHKASSQYTKESSATPVFLDPQAPSVTSMIFSLVKALGINLRAEEAELLLFGLCTDTGFFRHVTEQGAATFDCAAELVRNGASPQRVFNAINGGKTFNFCIFLGILLSNARSYFSGKLIVTHETLEETQRFGLEHRDSDSLYQLLQSIAGVDAVVVIRQETAQNCTVGLRSQGTVDVSKIAVQFGGGGHMNAAGVSIPGTIEEVWDKLQPIFKHVLLPSS
ncbi:MAG: bifunctional oligoribonuclease/PAP phosphatase NrnA [Spirochaetaceae bacterium]|jgi:phosphoesterase RecJ-like protein|nr:bifunctional oligoribonuclease/PAP phosphatase NrnA [Spirochaetaceae bacterium]